MAESRAMNMTRSRLLSTRNCVICCHESDFFCLGSCGHPVCFECGIRIRVVCQSKECPICRFETPEVYIVSDPSVEFESKFCQSNLMEHPKGGKYGIKFESKNAVDAFNDILAHVCTVCSDEPEFPNFETLQQHMRRQHELFYCDLCLSLKLFSWERKCYNRRELAHHRRVGDSDDRSHRGHPPCTFCDERFLDNDDLYRHLRRDHFYCHFCDADGVNHFYDTYEELRDHFREFHFLCEEGQCRFEQFVPAFRTEIDLKGHKAANHSKEMQKAQRRQERTLHLDFNYDRPGEQFGLAGGQREFRGGQGQSFERGRGGARGGRGGGRGMGRGGRQRENRRSPQLAGSSDNQDDREDEIIQIDGGNSKVGTILKIPAKRPTSQQQENGNQAAVDSSRKGKPEEDFSMTAQDFPSLGQPDGGGGGFSSDGFQNFAGWNKSSQGGFRVRKSGSLEESDFPALRSDSGQTVVKQTSQPSSPKGPKKPVGMVLIDDDEVFPSISQGQKMKERHQNRQKLAEKENITPSASVDVPIVDRNDNVWTKDGQQKKGTSLFETLTSGAWGGSRPKTLGQAAMSISVANETDFPSLDGKKETLKGQKEVKSVTLAREQAKSVWHRPRQSEICNSTSDTTCDTREITNQ